MSLYGILFHFISKPSATAVTTITHTSGFSLQLSTSKRAELIGNLSVNYYESCAGRENQATAAGSGLVGTSGLKLLRWLQVV